MLIPGVAYHSNELTLLFGAGIRLNEIPGLVSVVLFFLLVIILIHGTECRLTRHVVLEKVHLL